MLQAPDNKTYTVRVGDKLLDGTVKSINQEKVIFSQDVNDPLSLVKQREVPKPVRQAEGRGCRSAAVANRRVDERVENDDREQRS